MKSVLIVSLFIFITVLTLIISSDFNQDLGRHLALGKIIVSSGNIPSTNLFSYTNPNFPFINHHWLSEVIFYVLFNIHPYLLLLLRSLFVISAISIAGWYAYKKFGIISTGISMLIFSPLFLDRLQIRPEIFCYLFFSVLLFFLLNYPKYNKFLWTIPLMMILWVNIHISFVFGIFLIFLIFAKGLFIYRKGIFQQKRFLLILLLSLLATLINPHGINGALYPFSIFSNYGYTIVENQNVFYLLKFTSNPWLRYFLYLSPLIILSVILLLAELKIIEIILITVFYLTTIMQIRHAPFFILVAIPIVAYSFQKIFGNSLKLYKNYFLTALSSLTISISLLFTTGWMSNTYDLNKTFGVGYEEEAKEAVQFVKSNNLPDKIFNNFDIGGYLIYSLYPKYQFFVDNRPEAYPAQFLKDTYIRLQLDEKLRDEIFKKYRINTVIFSHTDQTDWGRAFIIGMYKNPSWKLVHLDSFAVVFTKDQKSRDIKLSEEYWSELISKSTDYKKLIQLMQVFQLFGRPDLTTRSFAKAHELNPLSCGLNKVLLRQYEETRNFTASDQLKQSLWMCF